MTQGAEWAQGQPEGKWGAWWPNGLWLGPADTGRELVAELAEVCGDWTVAEETQGIPAREVSVLVNAAALARDLDLGAVAAAVEGLVESAHPPARILTVITASWLGRGPSPSASARSAFLLAHTRHLALRLAPTPTTVNAVAVPEGFPHGGTGLHAPVRTTPGSAELAHLVRYFGHPDNGYVLGQLLSLCGGDDVWSNHSA